LKAGDVLTVEVDVKNTGSRPGDEVAELYLTPPHTDVSPALALAGFARVHLAPGETRHLRFELDSRTLSQVDDQGVRTVSAGDYRISLGGSQPGMNADETAGQGASKTLAAGFTIQGSQRLPR
jgi:beta-glucosidase